MRTSAVQVGRPLQPLPHNSRTSITVGMPGATVAGRQTPPTSAVLLSQLSPLVSQAQVRRSAAARRRIGVPYIAASRRER